MASSATPRSFASVAVAAFPADFHAIATEAVQALEAAVNNAYRQPVICMDVGGKPVYFPSRLHLPNLPVGRLSSLPLAARCLVTRSTDGHVRQRALNTILKPNFTWSVPFVVILTGEYAVEIVQDIQAAMLTLDRDVYANFVRENRGVMAKLRAKATSYWDCYYRTEFPEPSHYPGLMVLHEFERWAS